MASVENQVIERVCPRCGNVMKRDWIACPACGWSVTVQPPPPPMPQYTTQNISHGLAIASIICGILGFFIFGIIFGLLGLALGVAAVAKRDNLGYIGLILGIVIVILSIINMFSALGYYY